MWGWYDAAICRCWQRSPDESSCDQACAEAYCNELSLGGHDDWRLPTISELRSLFRGCPAVMIGGACALTDDCLSSGDECWNNECMDGCEADAGPGVDGCYWEPAMSTCRYPIDPYFSLDGFWSSSSVVEYPDTDGGGWTADFSSGSIDAAFKTDQARVLCVRDVL